MKPTKLKFLAVDLDSADSAVRTQALMDLNAYSYRCTIEDIPDLLIKLVSLLEDGSSQVQQHTMQVLATIFPRLAPSVKSDLIPQLSEKIGKLALGPGEMPVRTLAITLLCIVNAPNVVPIILELLKKEPEVRLEQLGIQNGLMHLRGHERAIKLRRSLSRELEEAKTLEARTKVLSLTDWMRSAGWAV